MDAVVPGLRLGHRRYPPGEVLLGGQPEQRGSDPYGDAEGRLGGADHYHRRAAAVCGRHDRQLLPTDNLSTTQTYYRVDTNPVQSGTSVNLTEYRAYSIQYWSVDDAGNEEGHHTVSVAVNPPDNVPPVTTFTGPSTWQKGFATFSLSAYDASSTVKNTFYSLKRFLRHSVRLCGQCHERRHQHDQLLLGRLLQQRRDEQDRDGQGRCFSTCHDFRCGGDIH